MINKVLIRSVAACGALVLWTLAGLEVAVGSARPQQHSKNAASEIRAVLDRQVDAWNQGNLEGFMEGYWNSADLTFFSTGTPRSGWNEAIAGYRSRYQSEGHEMGHLEFSDLRVEMLGPRAAYVRGHWHLTFTSGSAGGLFTLIFRKLPKKGWLIVHDHTSQS
jgi:beta-aspartyl-peptidase (threonine type)